MKKINATGILLAVSIIMLTAAGCSNINTEITIDAPIDAVWDEFSRIEEYPGWNPFIVRMETESDGLPEAGERILVEMQPDGGKSMTFKPKVLVSEPYRLVWRGRLFLPGLFDGEHSFILEEVSDSKTRFIQSEQFSGILVPFAPLDSTKKGFEAMNRALKERVEANQENPQ